MKVHDLFLEAVGTWAAERGLPCPGEFRPPFPSSSLSSADEDKA